MNQEITSGETIRIEYIALMLMYGEGGAQVLFRRTRRGGERGGSRHQVQKFQPFYGQNAWNSGNKRREKIEN